MAQDTVKGTDRQRPRAKAWLRHAAGLTASSGFSSVASPGTNKRNLKIAVRETHWVATPSFPRESTMSPIRTSLVGAILTAAVILSLQPAGATEVNFVTDFGYYGRHSYYYVAFDKGYYKQEGIELNFLRGQG